MPKIERPLPPYMQVIAHIRDQIDSGELRPGDLIPSDRTMAEEWGISRATAQKVVTALKAHGLVEAVQGSGTRVRASADLLHRSGRDRANSVRRTGRIYTAGEYARIVTAELAPAPPEVAEVLGISDGAPAIRRVRVTYNSDDQVISASTSWYDGALAAAAPRLLETERIKEGSWAYLEEQTGLTATYGQDRLSARLATQEEADLLGLTLPAAVKIARTILRDANSVAVEYGVSVNGNGRESIYDYDVS
ncbi:GntR family transcriptional regulator [Streptomyces anulatus]|uniref:GntR family transcriptional regulator n=1 Tax=Streptomyces anulatus TaxID=1892 RepID=UPI0037DDBAE0|nr:GntR family transcriptional regulator [Streptomyces anulatus]WSW88316.1 GntR family transcriptional regulator [Streptomyces anulatus]